MSHKHTKPEIQLMVIMMIIAKPGVSEVRKAKAGEQERVGGGGRRSAGFCVFSEVQRLGDCVFADGPRDSH